MDAKKIVIVGVPNSGKSTLFNRITKKYSMTANYPYTTMEEQRAKINLKNEEYEIVDTPGINSLDIFSEDELLVRNILIKEKPSVIIQCIDAVNIKRSLLLTAQLIELNIPLIICLNFVDEAQTKGIWVNREKLEKLLKVPAVETIANQGSGVKELINRITNARMSNHRVKYQKNIKEGAEKILVCFPNPPSPALLLLILSEKKDLLDWVGSKYGKDVLDSVKNKTKKLISDGLRNVSNRILEARTIWVEEIAQHIVSRSKIAASPLLEKIGELARHPVFGWPILAGVLFMTYLLVGRIGAVHISGWLGEAVFDPLAESIGRLIPWAFWREFLVGEYGLLTIGLFSAIGTVLPILTMFFLILSFLEDVGYIPNLCVLTNRFLEKVGLSGKAILSLVLGFGCKTMATLTTKTLDSWKERYIAIFLIAFCIPCSAELGLNLAILSFFPISATLIVIVILLLVELIAGIILNKLIKTDRTTDFILEVPPIRFPNLKNMGLKIYYRMKNFLKEAVPLFLIGAFALFSMDKLGILNVIRIIMSPIVEDFLSLPIKALEGFMLCLVRHEQGAAILLDLAKEGQFDYVSVIVCIIVITGFIPCFANIGAMIKQLKTKPALLMVPIITTSAILVGGLINWLLRFFI